MQLLDCVPSCAEGRSLEGSDSEGEQRSVVGEQLIFRVLLNTSIIWTDPVAGHVYPSIRCV